MAAWPKWVLREHLSGAPLAGPDQSVITADLGRELYEALAAIGDDSGFGYMPKAARDAIARYEREVGDG